MGEVLGEKYRIDGVIGRGGMGTVFRGEDLDLKRNVAVKVLHAAFSRNEIITRRFEREARSAAGLSHPNIVQVHDSGETPDGLRYLVMELLEGQELKAILGEPMPPKVALERAYQILSGLAYAHSQGIVHRDLKPENVFVTKDYSGDEIIKLVDFGVAKIVDPSADNNPSTDSSQPSREDTVALTQAGLIFGTPTYMSPEQATGTPVDARSDLYSFGVILFEMLSGRPPLYHKDPIRLIRMQVSVVPPPLAETFSEELRYFVHTLLAKERDDRFEKSEHALEELRALMIETPEGMPPGPALTATRREQWIKNTQEGREVLNHKDTHPGATTGPWGRARRSAWQRRLRLAYVVRRRWCIHHPIKAAGIAAAGLGLTAGLFFGVDGLLHGNSGQNLLYVSSEDTKRPSPSTTEIADIDRALLAKDLDAARKRLEPLAELYPENGQLLWREGKIRLAELQKKRRRPDERILAHYSAAIRADPKLLDDPEFYREIYDLLTHPSIRLRDAIEAAINFMGEHGHPYLLGLINKPVQGGRHERSAMSYTLRHRIIDTLTTKETSKNRIDQNIQLHRDLLQAHRQKDPCGVYLATLDAITKVSKRDYFLDPLHEARPPRPNPKNKDPQQESRCETAKIRLTVLREQLEKTYGQGVLEKPVVSAEKSVKAPAPAKPNRTEKKSGRSDKKSTKTDKKPGASRQKSPRTKSSASRRRRNKRNRKNNTDRK